MKSKKNIDIWLFEHSAVKQISLNSWNICLEHIKNNFPPQPKSVLFNKPQYKLCSNLENCQISIISENGIEWGRIHKKIKIKC